MTFTGNCDLILKQVAPFRVTFIDPFQAYVWAIGTNLGVGQIIGSKTNLPAVNDIHRSHQSQFPLPKFALLFARPCTQLMRHVNRVALSRYALRYTSQHAVSIAIRLSKELLNIPTFLKRYGCFHTLFRIT